MSLTGGGRMTGGAPAPYLTGSADISWSLDISRKTVYLQHLIGPVLKVCGCRRCRAGPRPWLARTASLERSPLDSLRSRAGAGEEKAAPSWRSPASIAGRQPTRLPGKTPATRGRRIALEHPRPAGSKGEANRHGRTQNRAQADAYFRGQEEVPGQEQAGAHSGTPVDAWLLLPMEFRQGAIEIVPRVRHMGAVLGVADADDQASPAPALPCGSFEGETTNHHGLSGTRTLFG